MALTPESVLRQRILEILEHAASGSLSRREVFKRMDAAYGQSWSTEDLRAPVDTRLYATNWQNRASLERARMVRDGIIVGAGDGQWTLSDTGKRASIKTTNPMTPIRSHENGEVTHSSSASSEKSFSSEKERLRREKMWDDLLTEGGPKDVSTALIRRLALYGGASGIFVHQAATKSEATPSGVAVSLLHTGKSYADELTPTGVLYHYPKTNRRGHDASEIEAARMAYRLSLPIFLIGPGATHKTRTIYRGYVESYDDKQEVFLVTFTGGSLPAPPPSGEPEQPFELTDERVTEVITKRRNRPNQVRFAFDVYKRYGRVCAVCEVSVTEMIQAAHLKAKSEFGSDDARNGLPLCANHHIAFDKSLWAINPDTTDIAFRHQGPTLQELGITRNSLVHLEYLPHQDALAHVWHAWQQAER